MIRWAPLILAILSQHAPEPLPSKGKGGDAGVLGGELVVGTDARTFRLVVPDKLDPDKPVPLLFAFHGLGDDKDFIRHYSGFGDLAIKKGFIAVFPAGLEKKWEMRAIDDNRDLRFFDALFEHVTSRYNVDLRRVYATGMSMGGFFANLLASKRSDKIAAIAPHSGGLGALAVTGIKAGRKYPVMIVQGDADRIVKVEQGRF